MKALRDELGTNIETVYEREKPTELTDHLKVVLQGRRRGDGQVFARHRLRAYR
jgi:hypothetical protein